MTDPRDLEGVVLPPQLEATKIGSHITVSREVLDGTVDVSALIVQAWRNPLTPAERLANVERRRAERVAERELAARVEPTLALIAERMGWSEAYVDHLVQPYCRCYAGSDGWEVCEHATDLGVTG